MIMPIAMTSGMVNISMSLRLRPPLFSFLITFLPFSAIHDEADSDKEHQGANNRANNDEYFRCSVHVSFRLGVTTIGTVWSAPGNVESKRLLGAIKICGVNRHSNCITGDSIAKYDALHIIGCITRS